MTTEDRVRRRALVAAVTLTLARAATVGQSPAVTDVVTCHNDNARTGQNLNESILTLDSVTPSLFGKSGFFPVDGKVDAQPLLLSDVTIPGAGERDVLYVVTEHDSVYALDAYRGFVLWQTSLLGPNETPSDTRGCSQVTPEIGITATPVID